jgi:hypothetical protein
VLEADDLEGQVDDCGTGAAAFHPTGQTAAGERAKLFLFGFFKVFFCFLRFFLLF